MKLHDLFQHHDIASNPFADEDAQTDPVFQGRCRQNAFHPHWDKIYGDPGSPATSIVFGEKGAGKTALRLQISNQIASHNASHEDRRSFVIEYDDFNPFLDRFAERLSARKQRDPGKVLAEWKLWDHMDAILSLGVTSLVDRILEIKQPSGPDANHLPSGTVERLDRFQRRDLLLLAACYDNSLTEPFETRWGRLRRVLKYRPWQNWALRAFGVAVTAIVVAVIVSQKKYAWLAGVVPYLIVALGWAPWLAQVWLWTSQAWSTVRNLRCVPRDVQPLRRVLMQFAGRDIKGQPLPNKRRTDDRYELLYKFQGVLQACGFSGIVVLVDRVDEPHLINGAADNMRGLVWSMLDNKFLKQPGLGLKMLLPIELAQHVDAENRDFFQRARLDKQNVVPSLEWTGKSLYDLADARVAACATPGKSPQFRALFSPQLSDERLIAAFDGLRVPRHLFKFLHHLLVAHCQQNLDSAPVWQVPAELFDAQYSLYRHEQQTLERRLGG
ncbi:MAG: hypothetical protein KDA61_04215 [Planctomycetales bacterium]|nr:hypothetical protein [Planctomycetales bacterium]